MASCPRHTMGYIEWAIRLNFNILAPVLHHLLKENNNCTYCLKTFERITKTAASRFHIQQRCPNETYNVSDKRTHK